MATTGIITVEMTDLALGSLYRELDNPRCRFERTAGATTESTNCVWIQGRSNGSIGEALETDSSIRDFTRLFESGDEQLYDLEFTAEMDRFREIVFAHDGTILDAYTGENEWTFHLRFPSRSDFSAAVTDCGEAEYDVTIRRVFDADSPRNGEATIGITDGQYEALCLAVENGYFEIPRQVTLQELAQMYGCTHQALSEMLRRATRSLATTITAANSTPAETGVSSSSD